MSYRIRFLGKQFYCDHPVRQWLGADRRGLSYKTLLLPCQDEKEYVKGGHSAFVWKNGAWLHRRISLAWGDFTKMEPVKRIPRSMVPFEVGDILVPKDPYLVLAREVRRISEIMPAAELSFIRAEELYNMTSSERNPDWQWAYPYRLSNDQSWYRKITADELCAEYTDIYLKVVEASLKGG